MAAPGSLIDSHGRVIRDLRISLTDRCNFRCLYCLPETEAAANFYQSRFQSEGRTFSTEPIQRKWQPRSKILTYEEIERVVTIFAGLGVNKVRLTGGEPLLRRELDRLIGKIRRLPAIGDIALTTNGFLFSEQGRALKEAGLSRISFSLDSLDRANFEKITGTDGLEKVVAAIRQARALGLEPVKVNAVIIRDINDHEIEALAEFAIRESVVMRFIEFMPLDSGRGWQKELVVSAESIRERLDKRFGLEPLPGNSASETARRWRLAGTTTEVGLIAPVSEPFCGHCNRIRLTADGKIRTCLFSVTEHDLRALLRGDASDADIADWLKRVVLGKEARHHIGEADFEAPERSMSRIGG